jgi:hypothetical protein
VLDGWWRRKELAKSRRKSSSLLLGLIPPQCVGLRIPDPGLLASAVGVRIVRMLALALSFHAIIFGGKSRMCAKIVSERQMSRNLCRTVLVTMKLHGSVPGLRIGFRAVAPSGQAKFAPPVIAERFHLTLALVQLGQVADHWYKIQNGLCPYARYCGRANVMNCPQVRPEGSCKQPCLTIGQT